MKIITFYSDSHKKIYDLFLTSYKNFLEDKHQLIVKKINQLSPSGEYNSKGFDITMLEKINWIIENIDTESEDYMVFADCDVQFFGDLDIEMGDRDILFQHDYSMFDFSWFPDGKVGIGRYPNYCAGFFICKQTEKIKKFFMDVKDKFTSNMNGILHDQTVINKIINEGYDINHDKLDSNQYWTVAFSTNGKVWDGQNIDVPKTIIVHHANFTVGVDNKIKLMQMVKEKIKNK